MRKFLLTWLIALCAVPAFAVEFTSGDFKANIYGLLLGDAFYTYSSDTFQSVAPEFGSMAFVGTSNIGVRMSYQNVSGTFEAGLFDPVRKFYLTYNIGGKDDHYVLVGRDNNLAFYYLGQMSNDTQGLIDYGTMSIRRKMQLRYGINGFELAVIIPYINFGVADDNAYTSELNYIENNNITASIKTLNYMINSLPRVEAAYTFKGNNHNMKVYASYAAYAYKSNTITYFKDKNNQDAALDSFDKVAHNFSVGFGGQIDIGKSFIQLTGYFGQNLYLSSSIGGYFADSSFLNPVSLAYNAANGRYTIDIKNIYSAGGGVGYGYKGLDGKLVTQVGVGYSANFADHFATTDQNVGAYLNLQYYFNDWFSILPELVFLKNIAGQSEGFSITAGAMAILAF